MSEDWSVDVRKYVTDADGAAIAGIIKHCGIALRGANASRVSFADAAETSRVRENFLKRKLGLGDPDSVLDAAIAAVGVRLAAPEGNRVTVYYLLAEAFGKLGAFAAGNAGPQPEASAPSAAQRTPVGWWPGLLLGATALIGVGLATIIVTDPVKAPAPVVVPAAAPVAAPEPAPAPAIPTGMGLTEQEVGGKPAASVYFATAKTEVSPDIVTVSAKFAAYLAANPAAKLAVSGFSDPRGNAAQNAELSKQRAFAVRDALVANGIAAEAIELRKPDATTDTTNSLENARRVDISIL